ncbi:MULTISPECIES: DNA-3-methyladenine glycosylase I [Vibrio]|uniref:DNA-3-methyladenine glycosylase I n=1 Tax=Vibrio casei TaxID=673372 RepID=A0A368LPE5_9VIBR|nr:MULTISPECIES: DNA-3-methyladenine glycosylase I [Vibrio]RCS73363.1 DNA-3-methyladenine glycosylase I [Vibrio casei]SJN17566.1 DNA-3-methyladenine glycosylase [Vibrio casei]HBV75838.1 DNA-3-methyladenine glycosylase I [Vibrio sp.]
MNTQTDTTCGWAMKHDNEREYHDLEWGMPVFDDRVLFEFICLEGAQAGLSWRTILNKRAGYTAAFEHFDIEVLARYDESHVANIIETYDVVKHKGKIASVFSNARAAQVLQKEYGSLSAALWQFVDGKPIQNAWTDMSQVPAVTEQSKAMSKFLKKNGFKFMGETICYAFMQATGMVNDHVIDCPCYQKCQVSTVQM